MLRRYTPFLLICALLFIGCLLATRLAVTAEAAGTTRTSVVTYDNPVPDVYITEYGQAIQMPVADNDIGNTPGWGGMRIAFDGTSFPHPVNQGTFYQVFSFNPAIGPNRVEYFLYQYEDVSTTPSTFTATAPVSIAIINPDDAQNAGSFCHSKGAPVNVTNGNMWLQQHDYALPGPGDPIEIDRFYNSIIQTSGLFGTGWTTKYDESLVPSSDDKLLRLNSPDGRASYFGRISTGDHFISYSQGVVGEIAKGGDGTYTLVYRDGRTHKFDSTGKLMWLKDSNGYQTTLLYGRGNKLSQITDSVGRSITISTNLSGNVTRIADAFSTVATYDYYGESNQLKTVTYNDGSQNKFEYDTTAVPGKVLLKTVKDALNNILETHAYDSSGRAITSEKDGGVEAYTFNYANPAYTTVTDARGNATTFYFKRVFGTNLVTRVDGLCGCGGSGTQSTQFIYDETSSWLNLKEKVDALGHHTTYTYDANRNIASITDPLGTRSFTYNSRGEPLTMTDLMNGVTTNTYDDTTGNLLTSTDPLNHTTTLTYGALGGVATFQDALGHTTTLTHDTVGRLTQITDANSKHINLGYDSRARVTSLTNALSETTSVEYDLNNRVSKVTYPDTHYTTAAYDLAGRRTSTTDELGHTTAYGYDNVYRLTSVTDALSHARTYGYDSMSNLTSMTDALSNVTDLEYDDFNRLKKVKYPLPAVGGTRLEENYTYDLNGNLKTRSDTAAHTTTYDYDTSDRMVKMTDPLSQITQFYYNASSQMTKVKDALNQEYTYTYDPLGRVLSQSRNGQSTTFVYDAVGNPTSRTDYNGNETTYAYDVLNRLTGIAYSESTDYATYGYDDLSRLTSAVNQNGTVGLTYDNRGRQKTETDTFGHVVDYTYDAAGRRTVLKLDNVTQTGYAYDNADRLTTLTDETSANFTFGYDNADRLTSQAAPNGVTTTYEYDGMSRLSRLKHVLGATSLYDFQYSFNAASQISQIVDLAGTRTFGYDNTDRLTSATGESYSYDAVGNRTASHLSSTYATGVLNRLSSTASASYSYDPNGSMIGKTVGSTNWTYGWDRENRMISAGNGTSSVSYDYDALGRRIKRSQGTAVEKYTHDGEDVVLDDVNSDLTTYQNGRGIDNKLKFSNGTTGSKFYMKDHLGSTIGTADATGTHRDAVTYDSFGNPSSTTYRWRHQFTGREHDPFTGLQFSRARFYDPQIGRFVSEDPIGLSGGTNLYGYASNNPQRFTDPSGLLPFFPFPSAYDPVPFNNGGELADWWHDKVKTAADFWGDPPISYGPTGALRLFGGLDGLGDMFRVGHGLGCALYDPTLQDFERFDHVAADVVRGGNMFVAMAAPFAGAAEPTSPRGVFSNPLNDVEPQGLMDQMVMDAAKNGAGDPLPIKLKDPNFQGMQKYSYGETSASRARSEVHYVRDPATGATGDFKFKHHAERYR